MSDRTAALRRISRALGGRDLIWGGLRSDDVEAISDLANVAESFSIIGGHDRGGAVPSLDFEDLSGRRVDLDGWDIEDHLDLAATHEFREALLHRLARPTALLPYRPSNFLSAILFARKDRCLDLGLFGAHQAMFDHKPWVEGLVADLGLPRIEWAYVADEEQDTVRRLLANGPVLLRVSRSSGGAGLVRVDDPAQVAERWPERPEGFVSVARYLNDALPINIGATVWRDGVTMNHPSLQMIGIPGCATRPFGYCGNDFGAVTALDAEALNGIETSVVMLGNLLRRYGYLGTFGVDFLVHQGVPLFSEINPRFQGSTHASSQLSSDAGESCIFLDHIAAVLGLESPAPLRLGDIVHNIPAFAHLVVHWTGRPSVVLADPLVDMFDEHSKHCRTDVTAKPNLTTATGGVVARVTARTQMTSTGFELHDPWNRFVSKWNAGALNAERPREARSVL